MLVAIVKKRLKLSQSLYTILQILSVTLFEKIHLLQAFADVDDVDLNDDLRKQLNLFT